MIVVNTKNKLNSRNKALFYRPLIFYSKDQYFITKASECGEKDYQGL